MIRQLMGRMFSASTAKQDVRERLRATQWPRVIYAIGDVHGCRDELVQLESLIAADAASLTGEKWIVMLGDYVDRGPHSAAVLDRLCARPPSGFRRICLVGNHETMMLAFMSAPDSSAEWLKFGGVETLASYGIDVESFMRANPKARHQILASYIPTEHIEFLQSLPVLLALPDTLFVHAGIRPGFGIEDQIEDDLLWIREPFLSHPNPLGIRVVHGHTPVSQPEIVGNRIAVDTGAFGTGILTAVRMSLDRPPEFLNTREPALR
ncbi:MAG: metallophosphoesterase family protein [Cypionkella sp.]